jgi:hypothetical protein
MFLYEQFIHLILRHEDGVYSSVGIEMLKDDLAGYLPMVGDRFTNLEDDHIHTYEVIARHNVHDGRYNERRWFLIVRDVGNTAEHDRLATCLRDISDLHASTARKRHDEFHEICRVSTDKTSETKQSRSRPKKT